MAHKIMDSQEIIRGASTEAPKNKYQKHKTGYKISATYFLKNDKSVNSNSILDDKLVFGNQIGSPLYIRVSFLKQTVSIKSRLNLKLTDENLDAILNDEHISEFMNYEKKAIYDTVLELEPDSIEDFKISTWTSYYNSFSKPVAEIVGEELSILLYDKLIKQYKVEDSDTKAMYFRNCKHTNIGFLASLGIQSAKDILSKYELLISILDYENELPTHAQMSLIDIKSGYYSYIMQKMHGHIGDLFVILLEEIVTKRDPLQFRVLDLIQRQKSRLK